MTKNRETHGKTVRVGRSEAIGFLQWEQLGNENEKIAYVKWNITTMEKGIYHM